MMTQVDIGLLAFIIISGLLSFRRGLVRQVGALVVLVIAILASMIVGPHLQPYFHSVSSEPAFQLVIAYIVTFFSIMVVGHFIVRIAEGILSSIGLSGTDRLLGIGFGMLRSALMVSGVLYGLKLTPITESLWWQQSVLIPQFNSLNLWVEQFLPYVSESLDGLKGVLSDVTEEIPPKAENTAQSL